MSSKLPPRPPTHLPADLPWLLTLIRTEFDGAPPELSARTPLGDLGDSLDWLRLLSRVDDEVGLMEPRSAQFELQTVGDLLQLLPRPVVTLNEAGAQVVV